MDRYPNRRSIVTNPAGKCTLACWRFRKKWAVLPAHAGDLAVPRPPPTLMRRNTRGRYQPLIRNRRVFQRWRTDGDDALCRNARQ
ncbi:hypothetical protein KCP77_08260 [Salmonella enterica subsp. enterica]|nr:hypothetical protein KCP77_08260 [Salmonella enterica subsp. enterica]